MQQRYVGFDLGAECIKAAEVLRDGETLSVVRTHCIEHKKDPRQALEQLFVTLDMSTCAGAAVTGRMQRMLRVAPVPMKAAVSEALPLLFGSVAPWTVVSIGSHGFAVVDIPEAGISHVRDNARCSQGTGNFLRQLVERFGLTLAQADELCAAEGDGAALSGRCPVILKTDMTHLANCGESQGRILAGLYDAVCDNVQTLVKPAPEGTRLLLIGGVARSSRIRQRFSELASKRGMVPAECTYEQARCLEAIGVAAIAARRELRIENPKDLLAPTQETHFERLPPLSQSLARVQRMQPTTPTLKPGTTVTLGLDIGSTGAKALALDVVTKQPVWHAYTYTLGNPVRAAQDLIAQLCKVEGGAPVIKAIGVTGSGREVIGSLLSSCYGREQVFVLNEIAAHAEGALHHNPNVDTIFEIGGQDAKYIRLDGGRICDAAMNEACSAGTGSFIEEQGRKLAGVGGVAEMSALALSADHGVSLGQHCSVFMAEIIDQATAAGVAVPSIVSGIYDAVVQNYLNRVKGTRSIGNLIFCQGMPFQSDALAAAVARQTGRAVVVPPHPGLTGALGIALLALRELGAAAEVSVPLARFLEAKLERRDQFVCPSTKGCGGGGNHCRVQRLTTEVAKQRQTFTWGGSCSLYDGATSAKRGGKKKLPDGAPEPFAERERLLDELCAALPANTARGTVAMSDEFALKGLVPFFATFVHALGYTPRILRHAGRADLRRGIDIANVPYCAPMQLYHGVVSRLLDEAPDYLLAPMLRELPRVAAEPNSSTCPVVQAGPGLIREALMRGNTRTRLLAPVVDMEGENFGSASVRKVCRQLAKELGCPEQWRAAFDKAHRAQDAFAAGCLALGERALAFARAHDVTPVVVLGRSYTIHNEVLNSSVPAILREQGALAIPVDCYPTAPSVPVFHDTIWHYSQTSLRAAHDIRRNDGIYGVFCSNYSCGPDSFNLHFFSYIMENKPFAIIETDGHSGDAGTKTRIEAFLYCVDADRKALAAAKHERPCNNLRALELVSPHVLDVKERGEIMLIPRMGVGAEVTAAMMRGEGMRAEALPLPDRDALALGRKLTSGKECIPYAITLGSTLARLEQARDSDDKFALLMPTASGPCRFGAYNLAHKIAFERAGYADKLRICSPSDINYFAGLAPDFQLRLYFGLAAADLLQAALLDVRPVEKSPGAAQAIFDRHYGALLRHVETMPSTHMMQTLREIPRRMAGVRDIIQRAAREFAAVKDFHKDVPTVAVVGEIYVRLDPFANDYIVERLEQRGVRARLAPVTEWIEYTAWSAVQRIVEERPKPGDRRAEVYLTAALQEAVTGRLHDDLGQALGWGPRTRTSDSLALGSRYVDTRLLGEAVLTLGSALHEYTTHEVDGALSVGPLECMPNKIAESHFARADVDFGIPTLTLSLNGDPVDESLLDAFVYEVRERRDRLRKAPHPTLQPKPFVTMGKAAARGLLSAALTLIPPTRAGAKAAGTRPGHSSDAES